MRKNPLFKKGLVIGIIVLFIGVAVIPSVNSINIVRNKNIQEIINNSVIEPFDSEEDCNCEVVSNSDIYRINSLLNRLEFIVKIISIRFRNNPEIKEKCQELLDLRFDWENTNSWDFPVLCTFLYPLWFLLVYLAEVGGTIIFLIVSPIFFSVNYLAYTLDCYWLTPV